MMYVGCVAAPAGMHKQVAQHSPLLVSASMHRLRSSSCYPASMQVMRSCTLCCVLVWCLGSVPHPQDYMPHPLGPAGIQDVGIC
jgi:hypothetical protein